MHAIEFMADLTKNPVLAIPAEFASQLPKSGKARVIILTHEDSDDSQWRRAAYEQFARDDAPEDAVYDSYK